MLRPRPPLSLRAALLLSAPLALLAGCFPDLQGAQCETDQNCPATQFCSMGTCHEGQRPPRAATLGATASLGTAATASVGQLLTLTANITNTGTVVLENIAPSSVTSGGTAAATVQLGPNPASVARLIPGASTSFTWTVKSTATGTLTFSATLRGTASDNGEAVTGSATTSTVTVQTAPSLEVSLTGPTTVSRGQTFAVTMTVNNRGQAAARQVVPAMVMVSKTGAASAAAGASPPVVTIDGGANASFQLTFTENGTGTGTLQIQASASGQDANGGTAVSSASGNSAAITVQEAAHLRIDSFTLPATIGRGGSFPATLTVTNTGEAAASLVAPTPVTPTLTRTGNANASTSTTISQTGIPGGTSHTFTWNYAENGTGTGTLQLAVGVSGTDANTGQAISAPSTSSNTAQVQAGGALAIISFTIPAQLSRGQTFTLSMTVQNTGGSAVNGVVPLPLQPTLSSTGGANATTSSAPAAFDIAVGASHTYTWTYTENGTATGTIGFTGAAQGIDSVSASTITAVAVTTANATVQTPPSLTVSSIGGPGNASRGQTFQVQMVVTNNGGATANNVVPLPIRPTVQPTGGAAATSSSAPAAQNIPGSGGTATFIWTFTENGTGTGTLAFTGGASGTDANSGGTVTAPSVQSAATNVQQPAALAVTAFTAPSTIMRGTAFTLTMVVSNTGQADANVVLPSPDPPTPTKTGGADVFTGSTQTSVTIAGGNTTIFTWTYTENGTAPGTLRFAAAATGTDANSGVSVNTASTNSNIVNVLTPPNLVVTSFTTSGTSLSRSQAFTASMTVQNQGGTTANNVVPNPEPPTVNVLTGTPGATTGSTHAPINIAAGGSTTFNWNYTENGLGSGTFTFSGGASGTNAVTGAAVTAPAVTTSTITVQTPAVISISSFTIPSSAGSGFNTTLMVQNSGEATASNVLPTPQAPLVTGGVNVTINTPPTAQSIAGGATVTFSWSYNVTGLGTVQLRSGAAGTDANSGAAVTAADTSSNIAVAPIAPPRDVDAIISVQPRIASPGTTVTVTMEVKNAGELPAEVAPPAALALEGPAEVELVSAPVRSTVRVAPRDAQRFEWTYRAVRHGWVTFSGAAKGLPEVTSRHLTVPAPWCATASSLLAFAGPARSGRCNQPLALGGTPVATGGAGLYRHEWTPDDGLSSALADHPTATPLVASTDYELTVTDADGCQARDSVRAEVTDAPVVSLSGGAHGGLR